MVAKHAHPEFDLQWNLVRWVFYTHRPLYDMLHHTANEGKRTAHQGANLKRMGMKKGFPDLFFYYPVPPYHGLALELKIPPNKVFEEQRVWLDKLNDAGYYACVVTEFSTAERIITDYYKGNYIPDPRPTYKDVLCSPINKSETLLSSPS